MATFGIVLKYDYGKSALYYIRNNMSLYKRHRILRINPKIVPTIQLNQAINLDKNEKILHFSDVNLYFLGQFYCTCLAKKANKIEVP